MPLLKWQKIAEDVAELNFSANNIAVAEVNGKKICIGRHQNNLYAFAYKCPHASGIMAEGYIDNLGNAVCPTHRYKFNIKNGNNVTGEGYHLKHWPIEQRPDGIFIGIEDKGLLSWF